MSLYSERVFPWIMDRLEGQAFVELKRDVVQQARGDVLEVGIGTGATLPHYAEGVRLHAVEPSAGMIERLRKNARRLGRDLLIEQGVAEALPYPDARFDTVIIILTLCSVTDPARAMQEVLRVLRPGGLFGFMEHVASEFPRSRRIQTFWNPVQRRVGCGCNVTRETETIIRRAGFERVYVRHDQAPIPGGLDMFPLIHGTAWKAGKGSPS